jgi:phage terminase large subunit
MIDINDKYKALFLNKDKRYNIVTGGRGSGKSFAVTLFLVLLTEQSNEVILFTRYTLISAHISIIPEFL